MNGPADFRTEPLGSQHDRAAFDCGTDELNRYLRTQATQDVRRKASTVFVMVQIEEPSRICAYFTLSACSLALGEIPQQLLRHLARYPQVSGTLLGRLAVDRSRQGQGSGKLALGQALRMAYENAAVIGSSLVIVDAIDETAAAFYQRRGFLRLPDSLRLIVPMRSVAAELDG